MLFEPKKPARISDSQMLEEIARVMQLFAGTAPAQAEFIKCFKYSMEPVRRRFGSYGEALRHAGFMPPEQKYTPKKVKEDLQRVLKLAEGCKFTYNFYRQNGGAYSIKTVKSLLGLDWQGVMTEIGAQSRPHLIRTTERGKKRREFAALSNEDLIEEIGRIWQEKGRRPTYGEFRKECKFGIRIYERRFGSWKTAVELYCQNKNITIQGRAHTYASKEILVNELRALQRKRPGDLLTYALYKKNAGTYSIGTFQSHFGSWTNAVQAAGAVSGRQAKYSKDALFDEMQRVWEILGEQPTRKDIETLGTISPKAYYTVFGSWQNAVLAFCEDRNDKNGVVAQSLGTVVSLPENIFPKNKTLEAASKITEPHNSEFGYEIRKTGRLPSKRQRFLILKRDNFTCQSCGRNPKRDGIVLHVDHIIAYANGGETVDDNLQALCQDCNLGKSDT
ncbi:MAG: HNH endonuclease [Micavibrio sp.]